MPIFPLSFRPGLGFHKGSGGRWFGSKRSDGRKHAACDLIAKKGTPIYAVADGLVLDKHYFYMDTYAIVVHHGFCIVRYGEIDKKLAEGTEVGFPVLEGQHIANVGRLSSGSSMLHFEMYMGTEAGNFTQKSNKKNYKFITPDNYQRRPDLLDPTPYLEQWALMSGV